MTDGTPGPCLAVAGDTGGQATSGTPAPADGAQLLQRLDVLQEENTALGRELLRSYEQLNLVFEITENIATLRDPYVIQGSLLRRFGEMLGAGAVFVDHRGNCVSIKPTDSLGRAVDLDSARVRATLADEIEQVRETRRARVPAIDEHVQQVLEGAHVMLAALPQMHAAAAVVVVLRHREELPFDSSDMLASESVLAYGGHILANVLMVRHLQQMAVETVSALANAIDAKDNYTCGHSERVGWLARLTGTALGQPETELEILGWAGLLHDVGKIGISDQIINKPGRLTEAEFEEMKRHPRLSYEVLKPVARLGPALNGVLYHHENWDGSGYPEGLRGEQIPRAARIIRVVDMFDALTSTRSYRQGFTLARAIEMLREESGRGTEPVVTEAFIQAFECYTHEQTEDFRRRFAHVANGTDQSTTLVDKPPMAPRPDCPVASGPPAAQDSDSRGTE